MGLKKGIQYLYDYLRLKYTVRMAGKWTDQARADFDAVENQWMAELAGAMNAAEAVKKSNVSAGVLIALLVGRDPFSVSRQMFQALKLKYS